MIALIQKSLIAFAAGLLIISIFAKMQAVEVIDANPVPFKIAGFKLPVTIGNPSNGSTQSQSFLAKFHANGNGVFYLSDNSLPENIQANYVGDFFYVLDARNSYDSGIKIDDVSQSEYPVITGQMYLSNLAPGNHSVTILLGSKSVVWHSY